MYDLISKIENITSFTQQLICFATASNLSSECLVRHASVKMALQTSVWLKIYFSCTFSYRLRRRRQGYGMFGDNDDDNDWTFNNPSYGANAGGNSVFSKVKARSKGYSDLGN